MLSAIFAGAIKSGAAEGKVHSVGGGLLKP